MVTVYRLRILFGCFVLYLISFPYNSNAWFTRLIKDSDIIPKNNTSACKKEIQEAILNLPKTSSVSFDCDNGLVKQVCVAESSVINSDWKSFITSNPALIGLKLNEFTLLGDTARPQIIQRWRGIGIRSAGISWSGLLIGKDKLVCIHPSLADTTNWNLDVTPDISSMTAIAAALKECDVALPRPEHSMVSWDAFVKLLTNEKHPSRCDVTNAKLDVVVAAGSPKLVWALSGLKNGLEQRYSFSCDVDAHTGLVVPDSKTGVPVAWLGY